MSFKSYLTEEEINEVLITFNNRPKFNQVVLLAGGAGCFAEDTKVITSEGDKNIQDIQPGDNVLSWNEATAKSEYKSVVDTFTHQAGKEILKLELEDGSEIICTEDHEFLVDGEWVQACELINKEIGV